MKETSKTQVEIKKEYYENGTLKSETPYKNGKKEGIEKIYCNREEKIVEYEIPYKNGKKEGTEIRYFPSTEKHYEAEYKDGKKNGLKKEYHHDVEVLKVQTWFKEDEQEGEEIHYFKSGDIKSKILYKNGCYDMSQFADIFSDKPNEYAKTILNRIFEDDRPRTFLGTSVFGDIFFKEESAQGETFKMLQIYLHKDYYEKEYWHNMGLRTIGANSQEFEKFISPTEGELVSRLFFDLMLRRGYFWSVKWNFKKKEHEIYATKEGAHFYTDQEEIESFYTQPIDDFYKEVLDKYNFSSSTLYDVLGRDDLEMNPLDVEKLSFSYGNERDFEKKMYDCVNLRHFSVYENSCNFLNENIKKLRYLSVLDVSHETSTIPQSFLDNIHKLTYLTKLGLDGGEYASHHLKTLPPKLSELKNLRYLSLSSNSFKDFSLFTKLKTLKELALNGNQITDIKGISQLERLEELNIAHNELSSLPNEIGSLKNLSKLYLYNNKLTSLQKEIGKLKNLRELDLSNNKIDEFPEAIKELPGLEVLELSGNPLTKLPDWICDMKNLRVLKLDETKLTHLPENIGKLRQLEKFVLTENPFEAMPPSMKKIRKKTLDLEQKYIAMYDEKAKARLEKLGTKEYLLDSDINFKLMVLQELCYNQNKLKLNPHELLKREIDEGEEGYDVIPEVLEYYAKVPIPANLLANITSLSPDGGDEIYSTLMPYWDGEGDEFEVENIDDVKYLPNLKRTNTLHLNGDLIDELEERGIEVEDY